MNYVELIAQMRAELADQKRRIAELERRLVMSEQRVQLLESQKLTPWYPPTPSWVVT